MEFKCEKCNRNFSSEESLSQHNSMKHQLKEREKIGFRKYFIISASILILVFIVLSVNSYMKGPGEYDGFAQCLTEKGVVIYGNDFCSYTTKQLNMFGKSKQYLNYVRCADNDALCDEKEVGITPTWWIGENKLSGVQGFDILSKLTGCEI